MYASGSTTRLGLPIFATTDTFSHLDFNTENNILDQYPGVFICTSTTRPLWGAAQSNMLAFETDTQRLIIWTGSAWKALVNRAQGAAFRFANLQATQYKATQGGPDLVNNYNIGTFNVPFANMVCTVIMTANLRNYNPQAYTQSTTPTIDGTPMDTPYTGGQSTLTTMPASNQSAFLEPYTAPVWCTNATSIMFTNSITAGTHNIGIQAIIPGYNPGNIGGTIMWASALILVTDGTF